MDPDAWPVPWLSLRLTWSNRSSNLGLVAHVKIGTKDGELFCQPRASRLVLRCHAKCGAKTGVFAPHKETIALSTVR